MAPSSPAPPSATARPSPVRVRFDRFELDEENASLKLDGKAISLAPTPFAVLCALVRHQGSLITKNALLDEVWGHRFVTESVLKTVIGKLRTALQDDARKPRFIETVSRRGYRFIGTAIVAASARTARTAPGADTDSFIGREDALARLHKNWNRASAGKQSIVWVAGEPGIGKTTLMEHFASSLQDVTCVHGQCVEQYGAGEPYLPILEALGQLSRRDNLVASLLRAVAPTWLIQLPWLSTSEERDALRRELAGLGPDRMLREMGEFLDRYTEQRPLLLTTEDLHWSDGATLQLLEYVARRRGAARLMWLASFRLSEVVALDHPLNRLRHELRLHRLCDEIVLDPFSEKEVARYVAQRSASIASDETFVRALHERTDGSPLFVAQIVSEVTSETADGVSAAPAAAQVATMAVPENLAAIIDRYIARLDDEQRVVLSVAAVCGVEFRAQTVADALGTDAMKVSQQCDRLVMQQLWLVAPRADEEGATSQPSYAFRHALFRHVMYERTAPAARANWHRKVGRALERTRADLAVTPAQLAMHFERGGEAMAAVRHYIEAAEAASLQFSPAESMMLAERGLILLNQIASGGERDAFEISLATLFGVSAAHVVAISSEQAKAALQRAYSLLPVVPDHPMRTILLHLLGLGLSLRGEYAEALEVAERSEAFATRSHDQTLFGTACAVHAEVRMLRGRPREAREWVERGLSACAASGPARADEGFVADPRVTLLGLLALQLIHLGLVESGRARLGEAHERARGSGQPLPQLIALWFEALFEVRLGNAKQVDAVATRMQELVDKFDLAQGRNAAPWFHGWAQARTGQPREGYRLIRDAHDNNRRLGMLSGSGEVLGYAAEALLLAGDLDAAENELREAMQIAEDIEERIYLPQLLEIEAAIARARRKPRDAEASLRRAVAEAREQQAPWLELSALLELCATSAPKKSDREALAALLDAMPEAKDTQAVRKARALLAA